MPTGVAPARRPDTDGRIRRSVECGVVESVCLGDRAVCHPSLDQIDAFGKRRVRRRGGAPALVGISSA